VNSDRLYCAMTLTRFGQQAVARAELGAQPDVGEEGVVATTSETASFASCPMPLGQ
jgi:hypothetical protein